MRYRADLHIHSPYSRATSKESTLTGLANWAKVKGISLLATGDCTHPLWLENLKSLLIEAEEGFYRLKSDADESAPRFVLSGEISSIYKKGGRVRKVHNLVYISSIDKALAFSLKLSKIGNIASDGRPILGLDSRNLLEILLETDHQAFLVPAHIWTPWFSIFGSKSGFDSVEECFGDLSEHIFALETGLSSDPSMNRLVSALDRYTLISSSDCHSPQNIGREATLFDTGFDFISMKNAIKNNSRTLLPATLEFFPQEGKYHADGHRDCNVRLSPSETKECSGICPVCAKKLTVGVESRIYELADRSTPFFKDDLPAAVSIIPLKEILSEITGVGSSSKRVDSVCRKVTEKLGSELDVLVDLDIKDILLFDEILGEGIKRLRSGDVKREAGYDGVYGRIRLFDKGELPSLSSL